MAKSYIVLISARSGSTYSVDTINRHPDLSAFGQQFNPDTIVRELQRKYDIINMARRYLRWLRMPHHEVKPHRVR